MCFLNSTRCAALSHSIVRCSNHACSQAERKPFYYLNHDVEGLSHPTRSDEEIADLLVDVGVRDKSLAQVLLQQATEHGFALACQRLIAECGANPDECSEEDSRIARQIGIGAKSKFLVKRVVKERGGFPHADVNAKIYGESRL